jgi:hypothetical protein
MAGISGSVTDPSGAAVPGATIQVRQLDGTTTANARTDVTGQFSVPGLPAGRYELQIAAQGFRQASKQIDLRPQKVASVKSQLEIGSVTETVDVTAAASTIQTSNASVGIVVPRKKARLEEPRPLPSRLPAETSVTSGKIILAVDSAGAVFTSRNSGKSWKTVKPVWSGKAQDVALVDPSRTSIATFELTTDSGSVWLSRDGAHWYTLPPQR